MFARIINANRANVTDQNKTVHVVPVRFIFLAPLERMLERFSPMLREVILSDQDDASNPKEASINGLNDPPVDISEDLESISASCGYRTTGLQL
jgi:hypothetical protein